MKTTALAQLFLLLGLLSFFYQETDADCSGCGCNIFCCNCDFECVEDYCGSTGCCELGMTQEESVENCCKEKTVGNITYTLLPEFPDIDTHPKSAKDGCIYTVKGDPSGERFAFEHGHLPVECFDENQTPTTITTPVENVLIFEENGETFEQKDSYNPDTKEVVSSVPAHGDFPATTFIMQGRSSDSPAAGKMIVSTETECSFEDIPEEIVPENLMMENRGGKKGKGGKKVKKYRIRSNIRKVTEEERENLTESMKSECAGKTVVTSSIETVNEDEYLRGSNFSNNFIRSLKRVNTEEVLQKGSRAICNAVYYGCANTNNPSNCLRWNYDGQDPFEPAAGIQRLSLHSLTGENYCTNCCHEQSDTIYPLCSCITDEQRFSTAFAISRQRAGCTNPDCIKRSNYCKWDPDTTIQDCHYTPSGACVMDSSCPMGVAIQGDCA